LKRSSCCPRILAYGHLKVVVCSFEAAPHFGSGHLSFSMARCGK
jgi:hypothetical protein